MTRRFSALPAAVFSLLLVSTAFSQPTLSGDFTGDGLIDLDDFAFLPQCLAGPGGGIIGEPCSTGDFHADSDVDLRDLALFQHQFLRSLCVDSIPVPWLTLFEGTHYSLAVGDLNHDGRADVAVGNVPQRIGIFLSGVDGVLAEVAPIFVGHFPTDIRIADLNADGHRDLVVGDSLGGGIGDVYVFWGAGDGTFGAPNIYPLGFRPIGMAIGDFNADGHSDLVFGTPAVVELSVWLNSGNGAFLGPIETLGESLVYDIGVGDLDGDGDDDLLMAYGTNDLAPRLSNGDGTFSTGMVLEFDNSSIYPHLGDLNGDGLLDAVVAAGYPTSSVYHFRGTKEGSFELIQTKTLQGLRKSVDMADLNDDGFLDAVVGTGVGFAVFMNDGAGRLRDGSYQVMAEEGSTTDTRLGIGDVNGDGKFDITAIKYSGNEIMRFRGRGNGTFLAASQWETSFSVSDAAAADFDNDGDDDIMIVSADGMSLRANDGSGLLNVMLTIADAQPADDVAAGDFNGDGHLDLATIALDSPKLQTYLGLGDNSFVISQPVTVATQARSLVAAQLVDNGQTDIAVAALSGLYVLAGRSDGPLQNVQHVPGQVDRVAAGDINGDGRADLITWYDYDRKFRSFLASPDGTLIPSPVVILDRHFWDVEMADVNGDGLSDVVFGGPDAIKVLVALGDGSFEASPLIDMPETVRQVVMADANGDGRADVVAAGSDNLLLLTGLGGGAFAEPVSYDLHDWSDTRTSLISSDLDQNGTIDFVLSGTDPFGLTVVLNACSD